MTQYYFPGWGWLGGRVEIISIKAVLSSTGLELELSLAKFNKSSQQIQILEFGAICQVTFKNYFERMFNVVAHLFSLNLPILHGSHYGMSL